MLTPFDDYPVHQSSLPLAHTAAPDRNFYDRYFFNGHDPDGELFFAAALGFYPNRQVVDGAFAVLRDGRVDVVNVSGRIPDDRTGLAVGPLRVEVLQPLRDLGVTLDATDLGLQAAVRFEASSPAFTEPRFLQYDGPRVVFDYTRMTQMGRWTGTITVDGHDHVLDRSVHLGTRDRSWGTRPVGEQPELGAPLTELPQFFWIWSPLHLDDGTFVLVDVNEHADGRRWHEHGALVPALPATGDAFDRGEVERAVTVDHDIGWAPGTRRAHDARLGLTRLDGTRLGVELEPLATFPMSAIGYLDPEWGHGRWKDELAVARRSWNVADVAPTDLPAIHVQQICRVGGDLGAGTGVLELLALGEHGPSGLTGFLEGMA